MSKQATCLPSAAHVDCSSPADGVLEGHPSSEALPFRLQAITPEESFTSASGFYSPRSHMASRQQSASSSDAWFDAHSQMASRASSVSTSGTSAALPAATSAGITVGVVLYALKRYYIVRPGEHNLLACSILRAASNQNTAEAKVCN